MPFLENLRQQKELRRQQEERRVREAIRLEETRKAESTRLYEEAVRRDRERKVQLERDIKKAQEYFDKSDFPRLSRELASVIERKTVLVRGVVTSDVFRVMMIYEHGGLPDIKAHYLDTNNQLSEVGVSLIWYQGKRGPWREKTMGYPYKVWEDEYRFITIGCDQSGKITLGWSRGEIELPQSRWMGNHDAQEKALEKAFNNPKRVLYRQDNLPHWEPRGPNT